MAEALEKVRKPEKSDVKFKRNLSFREAICCFYVFTIVIGSIFGHLISFKTYWSNEVVTFWSKKSNFVNQYFVKIGWFWTSVCFFTYAILYAKFAIFRFKRWALATLYWFITTQWFFGPSIMDRIFVMTGGGCSGTQDEVYEAYVCKSRGGLWKGGHDLSGHCFLLIHASLFLLEEFIYYVEIAREKRENKILSKNEFLWEFLRKNKMVGLLLFLWWWMLFMTAVYFHSFQEKFTGTMFGILYWAIMYIFAFPKISKDFNAREI
jgi:hypothetical protein